MNYFLKALLTIILVVGLAACGSDPEPPALPTPIPADETSDEVTEVASESPEGGSEESVSETGDEEASEETTESGNESVDVVEADASEADVVNEAVEENSNEAEPEVSTEEVDSVDAVEEPAEESNEETSTGSEDVAEEPAEASTEESTESEEATEEVVEPETSEDDEGTDSSEKTDESAEESSEEATEDTPETAMADVPVEMVEPRVFFLQPTNYAAIPPVSTIVMGVEGLVVEPAGEIHEGAGHLHILIDTDFIAPGEVIPNDENHLHYGNAQLSAEVELTPGEHTLRLQFANGAHIALEGDAYRAEINVTVAEDAPEQGVYFVSPNDGDTVSNPIEVIMAASGMMIEPAGEIREGAGHLHILVNTEFIAPGEVIVNDEIHLHYGKAQTETALELEPGEYVLRLQLANGAHIALEGEQYQDEITITVE